MTVFPVLLIYLITNFFQVNFAIIPKKIAYFEEIIKLEYINFNIKGKLTSNIFARALNSRVARKLMEKYQSNENQRKNSNNFAKTQPIWTNKVAF